MYDISPRPASLICHLCECRRKGFAAWMLVVRSIKVRYIQTVVGPFWILLQPLFQIVLMTLVFGNLIKVPTGVNYVLFALVSMPLWSFVSNAAERGSSSIILYQDLITRVRLPALIYPITNWVTALVDFCLVVVITGFLLLFIRPPALHLIPIACAIVGLGAVSMSFGVFFSICTVFVRDFKFILPLLLQVLFYCSPIVYPLTRIPQNLMFWYQLNPMVSFFELYRSGFGIPHQLSLPWLIYSVAATLVSLLASLVAFNRIANRIPDYL